MGEIIPSESLSRVTYTGNDGIHSQKTKQPYIWSAGKNRTRKKSAVEEDQQKAPRRIRKMSLKKKCFEENGAVQNAKKQIP